MGKNGKALVPKLEDLKGGRGGLIWRVVVKGAVNSDVAGGKGVEAEVVEEGEVGVVKGNVGGREGETVEKMLGGGEGGGKGWKG